jgi:hypothetical protein
VDGRAADNRRINPFARGRAWALMHDYEQDARGQEKRGALNISLSNLVIRSAWV